MRPRIWIPAFAGMTSFIFEPHAQDTPSLRRRPESRYVEIGVGVFLAGPAYSFQPEWMAAMPPVRLRTETRSKPASRIIDANASWFGKRRMLSTR